MTERNGMKDGRIELNETEHRNRWNDRIRFAGRWNETVKWLYGWSDLQWAK